MKTNSYSARSPLIIFALPSSRKLLNNEVNKKKATETARERTRKREEYKNNKLNSVYVFNIMIITIVVVVVLVVTVSSVVVEK